LDEAKKASQNETPKFDSEQLTLELETLKSEHKLQLESLTSEKDAEI